MPIQIFQRRIEKCKLYIFIPNVQTCSQHHCKQNTQTTKIFWNALSVYKKSFNSNENAYVQQCVQ